MNWPSLKTWLIFLLSTFVSAAVGAGKEYLMAPPTGVDMKHMIVGAVLAGCGAGVVAVVHLYQPVPVKKPDASGTMVSLFVACAICSAFCTVLVFAALLPGCGLTGADFKQIGACSAKYDACFAAADLKFKAGGDPAAAMAQYRTCRDGVDAECLAVPSPSASAAPSASAVPSVASAAPVASGAP